MQQLETCTIRSSFHLIPKSRHEPNKLTHSLTQHSQHRAILNVIRTISLFFRGFDQLVSNLSASLSQRAIHADCPARNVVNKRKNRTNDVDKKSGIVAVAIVKVPEDFVDRRVDSVDRLEIVSESSNSNGIESVVKKTRLAPVVKDKKYYYRRYCVHPGVRQSHIFQVGKKQHDLTISVHQFRFLLEIRTVRSSIL